MGLWSCLQSGWPGGKAVGSIKWSGNLLFVNTNTPTSLKASAHASFLTRLVSLRMPRSLWPPSVHDVSAVLPPSVRLRGNRTSAVPLWRKNMATCTYTHLLSSSVTPCHCASCGLLVVCSRMPNTTTNAPDAPPGDIKLSTLVPILAGPLSFLQICLSENFFFLAVLCVSLLFSIYSSHYMFLHVESCIIIRGTETAAAQIGTSLQHQRPHLSLEPSNQHQPGRSNELGRVLTRWRRRVEKLMIRSEESESQVGRESEVSWCEHEVTSWGVGRRYEIDRRRRSGQRGRSCGRGYKRVWPQLEEEQMGLDWIGCDVMSAKHNNQDEKGSLTWDVLQDCGSGTEKERITWWSLVNTKIGIGSNWPMI